MKFDIELRDDAKVIEHVKIYYSISTSKSRMLLTLAEIEINIVFQCNPRSKAMYFSEGDILAHTVGS